MKAPSAESFMLDILCCAVGSVMVVSMFLTQTLADRAEKRASIQDEDVVVLAVRHAGRAHGVLRVSTGPAWKGQVLPDLPTLGPSGLGRVRLRGPSGTVSVSCLPVAGIANEASALRRALQDLAPGPSTPLTPLRSQRIMRLRRRLARYVEGQTLAVHWEVHWRGGCLASGPGAGVDVSVEGGQPSAEIVGDR